MNHFSRKEKKNKSQKKYNFLNFLQNKKLLCRTNKFLKVFEEIFLHYFTVRYNCKK